MKDGYRTNKQARLIQAAALDALIPRGKGWRAHRFPRDVVFSGAAVTAMLRAGVVRVMGKGNVRRLTITARGRSEARHLPRMCISCGCTETHACSGGCAWATQDLCTACVPAETLELLKLRGLEIRVRNIVFNAEQLMASGKVAELIASLRSALGLKPGERP